MEIPDILARLKDHEPELQARGVRHAAVLGSRARADHRPDSDTDILVEWDRTLPITIYDYAGVIDYVGDLFEGAVDVVERESLKPRLRPGILSDAIYAF